MNKSKKNTVRVLSLILGLLLTLGCFAGCSEQNPSSAGGNTSSAVSQSAPSSEASQPAVSSSGVSDASQPASVKTITFKVIHGDKSTKEFTIETESANLRGALEQENLISGDESSYGLFVTEVDGETADDSKEQWWCLTKGGETWNNGVDNTEIADGDVFEFTLTEGY